VLVAWTTPAQLPRLAGDIAGLGGSMPVADTFNGTLRYVTGTVSRDAPQLEEVLRRPHGRDEVRAIVMHELGHLVGLAHVSDPSELMFAENTGLTDLGAGDREGLAALGKGACSS
jgi:predicted Zn-dependent protease